MKVIVVEDETKIREGLRKVIEDVVTTGLILTEASNGKEAVDWLKTQEHVDLIISDIRMNEMNGIELLKWARQARKETQFVIISGYDEFVYVREALRHGALDYLLKPIDRVELARILGKVQEMTGYNRPDPAKTDMNGGEDHKERLIIRKVKEFIHQSLDQNISLALVAQHVYLHPKYLSDLFKRETGQNLSDYVTECRLEKAKKLLKETSLRIADIAPLCGVANHKYFASLFKQHVGCTPTEFRELE